jgi:hypothetical protein
MFVQKFAPQNYKNPNNRDSNGTISAKIDCSLVASKQAGTCSILIHPEEHVSFNRFDKTCTLLLLIQHLSTT